MAEFLGRDISKLWDEILQRHWTYLETEDGLQKLDERKKLEGCLKEFLCIVPHDRKFFLPETAHVLKKSIKDNIEFSAYKAMIGFESISQYANNLFTKPWRKEYRVIKMYSGFYQHEIKSNLIDAEKLFEAMGYRQLPNQLLVLDGPICPDQVTNVSRDAMAAYVECQVMKQILNGLSQMQLAISWSDLFSFRESHICGISQGVKSIAYTIHERRFRKEKLLQENYYAQPTVLNQPSGCAACYNTIHSCHHPTILPPPCQIHGATNPNGILYNKPPTHQLLHQQSHYYNHYHHHPQIPHSKSLEHYKENQQQSNLIPSQRHSFDHPSCDSYHQNCQLSMYNHHPYNVSGNRYPLPYPLSTQLNNVYGGQPFAQTNGHYAVPTNCTASHKSVDAQHYSCSKAPVDPILAAQQNCVVHPILRNGTRSQNLTSHNNSDHLIDFNEEPHQDFANELAALALNEHHQRQFSNRAVGTDDLDGPAFLCQSKLLVDKNSFEKSSFESRKSYDNNLSNQSSTESTKSSIHKNHDGVGSFETWDFVFQNLEKHNYTKDLGGRGDLLVQGLNLDSAGEKRKSNSKPIEETINSIGSKAKISEARIVTNRQSSSTKSFEKLSPSIAKITKTTKSVKNSAHNSTDHNGIVVEKKKILRKVENGNHNNNNNNNNNTKSSVNEKNPSKVNEWSCRFCTFLNPEDKRICEMCCRSKDFNLDAKPSSTCVYISPTSI